MHLAHGFCESIWPIPALPEMWQNGDSNEVHRPEQLSLCVGAFCGEPAMIEWFMEWAPVILAGIAVGMVGTVIVAARRRGSEFERRQRRWEKRRRRKRDNGS